MKVVISYFVEKILRNISKRKQKLLSLCALLCLNSALFAAEPFKSEERSNKDKKKENFSSAASDNLDQLIAACPKNAGARSPAKKSIAPRINAPIRSSSVVKKPNVLPGFKNGQAFADTPSSFNKGISKAPKVHRAPKVVKQQQPVPPAQANNSVNSLVKSEENKNEENAQPSWDDKQAFAKKAAAVIKTNLQNNPTNQPDKPDKPEVQPVSSTTASSKREGRNSHDSLQDLSGDDLKNGYTVNFQDISIVELLQFVSKISGTNFVFESQDLQFNVTIVSHDPTSVEDLSTILLQVLKMHDLKVVEQGNNVLIYRNPNISKLSTVVTDGTAKENSDSVVVTRVFKLYSVSPSSAVSIIQPLLSHDAIVSASENTRHVIVSDISGNVEKVGELLSALDGPGTSVDMSDYEVLYANPQALVSYCQDVLGAIAEDETFQIFIQPGTTKIFVVSSPRLTAKAIQLLKSLDVPEMAHTLDDVTNPIGGLSSSGTVSPKSNRFFMYKLKYQNGAAIAQALQDIGENLSVTNAMDEDFINTMNSIQWLDVNNSIVVVGNQANVDKVVSLLNGLDLPPKQVYIEVLILETSLENSWDFGVQWIALGNEQDKLAYASGLLSNAPPSPGLMGATRSTTPPSLPSASTMPLPTPSQLGGFSDMANLSSAFGLGIIGNVLSYQGKSFLTLGGLLSALDQDGDTIIVLNPRIMAQDTQKASFFVGQTIPYQTTSTVIQETGSVTQNIEYEDIGVNLIVTSTVAPNNVVTLQIEQTISEIHSAGATLTPTTDKTYAATRLQVPDGCFLVMSGHIRDKTTKITSGVPLLGSIPLIKGLFSRTVDQRQKRNIMMFIKPKVITSFEEGTALTNKEGYRYNWEADKCSMEVAPRGAPECQKPPVPVEPAVDPIEAVLSFESAINS